MYSRCWSDIANTHRVSGVYDESKDMQYIVSLYELYHPSLCVLMSMTNKTPQDIVRYCLHLGCHFQIYTHAQKMVTWQLIFELAWTVHILLNAVGLWNSCSLTFSSMHLCAKKLYEQVIAKYCSLLPAPPPLPGLPIRYALPRLHVSHICLICRKVVGSVEWREWVHPRRTWECSSQLTNYLAVWVPNWSQCYHWHWHCECSGCSVLLCSEKMLYRIKILSYN